MIEPHLTMKVPDEPTSMAVSVCGPTSWWLRLDRVTDTIEDYRLHQRESSVCSLEDLSQIMESNPIYNPALKPLSEE